MVQQWWVLSLTYTLTVKRRQISATRIVIQLPPLTGRGLLTSDIYHQLSSSQGDSSNCSIPNPLVRSHGIASTSAFCMPVVVRTRDRASCACFRF